MDCYEGNVNPNDAAGAFQQALNRLRRTHYTPRLPETDLTPAETHVLMAVGRIANSGNIPRPREIGRSMNLSPSALSQTLGSLERKGYIERARDAADARKIAVELTEKGRGFVDSSIDSFRTMMSDLRTYLGEDDLREFARLLNRVDAFFQEQVASGKVSPHPHRGPHPHVPCDATTEETSHARS